MPAAAAPVSYAAAPGVVSDAGDGGPAPTSFGSAIDHSRVTPISSLNPYSTANWTIKARVSNKSQIRTYAGKNGQGGRLFSVELVDQDGEIRATGFGNTVDSLYPVLQQGKVYYISRGDVKQANKKFTGSINNNYEVTFNHNTSVELAVDDTDALPTQHYRFTRISDLPDVGVGNTTGTTLSSLQMHPAPLTSEPQTFSALCARPLKLPHATRRWASRLTASSSSATRARRQ